MDEKYVKIHFRLEKDEDGYPPDDWESLWAIEFSPNFYTIDNIPFFVRGISNGDIVSVNRDGEDLIFNEVTTPSPNSVLRVVVFDVTEVQGLRDNLRTMGCPSELSDNPAFFSVEVPSSVPIEPVLEMLAAAEENDRLEYEEASLRHEEASFESS